MIKHPVTPCGPCPMTILFVVLWAVAASTTSFAAPQDGKSTGDMVLNDNVVTAPDVLDFGDVNRDSEGRTQVLVFTNCRNISVNFNAQPLTGPDAKLFRVLRNRFVVQREDRVAINILFRPPPPQEMEPNGIKTAFATFVSRTDTIRVELRANMIQDRTPIDSVYIPALSGAVGDTINVPVILERFDSRPYALTRVNFARVTFTINATVLAPANISDRSPIVHGIQAVQKSLQVTRDSRIDVGDTLFNIPMVVMLGDLQQSEIQIIEFTWNVPLPLEARDTLLSPVAVGHGSFAIEDVYYENGIPRLLNVNQADLELDVSPNPASASAMIRATSVPQDDDSNRLNDVLLVLYNSRGEVLRNLTDLLPREDAVVEFELNNLGQLASGLYYLRLSINANSITRLLIIE